MDDSTKSTAELLRELCALRRRVGELESRAGRASKRELGNEPGQVRTSNGVSRDAYAGETGERQLKAPFLSHPRRSTLGALRIPEGAGLLRSVVANAPIVLWAVDREGRFLLSEGRGLESLGLKPGEVVGRTIDDLYGDVPEILQSVDRALAGESFCATVEVEGLFFDSWYAPLRSAEEGILGVVGFGIDVTERRRVEEALLAERKLLEQILVSHDRDRRLIAYEIHDGLVQDATGAQMQLEALLGSGKADDPVMRQGVETVLELVRDAVVEARRLIAGLRPPILDEGGIVPAIEYLVGDRPDGKLRIEFVHDVQFERLEPILEGTIYRIVQEAITNVQKHSRARRALVRLDQAGGAIRIEIRDWGVGFDPAQVTENRYGLQGIRERARLFHGHAVVESSPGEGTRVFVELPISQSFQVTSPNNRSVE